MPSALSIVSPRWVLLRTCSEVPDWISVHFHHSSVRRLGKLRGSRPQSVYLREGAASPGSPGLVSSWSLNHQLAQGQAHGRDSAVAR